MARQFAKAFYHSRAWRECRASLIKERGGLCENCMKSGIATPGSVVHHVIELNEQNINDPEITLNHSNLVLLCPTCHEEIHGRVTTAFRILPDGRLAPRM